MKYVYSFRRNRLLNPHGSDETHKTVIINIYNEELLNPHGSDETSVSAIHLNAGYDFLTHTVQMKQKELFEKIQESITS